MRSSTNILDLVANDLASWLDEVGTQLAEAMSSGGAAPFAAQLTEQQKLDYYRQALFGPDGSPNLQGRAKEMARLGPENFSMVFRAVIKAHPELSVPPPPLGAPIPVGPLG